MDLGSYSVLLITRLPSERKRLSYYSFGRLRWEDTLRPGGQDQPGQRSETPFLPGHMAVVPATWEAETCQKGAGKLPVPLCLRGLGGPKTTDQKEKEEEGFAAAMHRINWWHTTFPFPFFTPKYRYH
ncbi:hypothetical protein AAY473_016372 [Plecturocebus cupreus]